MFKALWKWLINIGFFRDTSHTPLWNSFYLKQKFSKYLLDLFRPWLSIKTCLDVKCSLEILCQTVPVLLMTQVRKVFLQLGYKEEFNPPPPKKNNVLLPIWCCLFYQWEKMCLLGCWSLPWFHFLRICFQLCLSVCLCLTFEPIDKFQINFMKWESWPC